MKEAERLGTRAWAEIGSRSRWRGARCDPTRCPRLIDSRMEGEWRGSRHKGRQDECEGKGRLSREGAFQHVADSDTANSAREESSLPRSIRVRPRAANASDVESTVNLLLLVRFTRGVVGRAATGSPGCTAALGGLIACQVSSSSAAV